MTQGNHAGNRLFLSDAQRLQAHLHASSRAAFRRYLVYQGLWLTLLLGGILLALLSSTEVGAVLPLEVGTAALAIAALIVFARMNQLRDQHPWIALRSAADGLGRAVYLYRTVLQALPERHHWLLTQLQQIQQRPMVRLLPNGPSAALTPQEDIPSSLGCLGSSDDLLAEGYITERIEPRLLQLAAQVQRQQRWQQVLWFSMTLLFSFSILLPVVAHQLGRWAALPLATSMAVGLWANATEISNAAGQATQQQVELTLIRDRWLGLLPSQRCGSRFFELVMEAEALLAGVPTGIPELEDTDPTLLQAVTETPGDLDERLQANGGDRSSAALTMATSAQPLEDADNQGSDRIEALLKDERETYSTSSEGGVDGTDLVPDTEPVPTLDPAAELIKPLPTVPRGAPHAFVVMPFGRKQGPDGSWIDFNRIYEDLIKPALLEAGFEPFRADEEASSGDILTDMFQELLLADLVIADLSIDNANVFYELGIRHAMRRRGIVHIQSGRAYMPFDIFNVRTIPYHCDDTGCPDPEHLKKDKQAMVRTLLATWESDRNAIHSPIFNLLDGLVEPDRKTLRTPLATGYWEEYTSLQQRLQVAQRQKRIGDVLLLTEEVKNSLVKEDVLAYAGRVLRDTGNSALALKQYRQGLELNPDSIEFRCEEAYHLSRLQQPNEAIVKLEDLLKDEPYHTQAMAYLARIYKDLWKGKWTHLEDQEARIQAAYGASHFLQKSIENYLRAFRIDQNDYYPGINAYMLTAVLDYLAERVGPTGDPDEEAYRRQIADLKGAVEFCLRSRIQNYPNDFWAASSLGDLAVCSAAEPIQVAIAYKKALTALWNQKFALQSILDQLELLSLLAFRPEHVAAGQTVLDEELQRFNGSHASDDSEDAALTPVFMFSGHMIDSPTRPKPRFPNAMEPEAKRRIEAVLKRLGAQATGRAICGGIACGGDILFLESCLARGMMVDVFLPFDQAEFIQDSVNFAGDRWVERFYSIANHPNVTIHLQSERLGKVPEGEDIYSRNNRWTLYNALTYRIDSVRLIVLWNGQGGDGPGGTNDMVQQVRQLGGIVEHIDTTKFDYWQEQRSNGDGPKAIAEDGAEAQPEDELVR